MIEVISMSQAIKLNQQWRSDKSFLYIGCGSLWGNPFHIGPDGSRVVVIRKYLQYAINTQFFHDAIVNRKFENKKLVCYCAPRACHGDVLKNWQENYIKEDQRGEDVCSI